MQRIYFLSDRDGVMNVYSMDTQGRDVKQESHQRGFDIASASPVRGPRGVRVRRRSLVARSESPDTRKIDADFHGCPTSISCAITG